MKKGKQDLTIGSVSKRLIRFAMPRPPYSVGSFRPARSEVLVTYRRRGPVIKDGRRPRIDRGRGAARRGGRHARDDRLQPAKNYRTLRFCPPSTAPASVSRRGRRRRARPNRSGRRRRRAARRAPEPSCRSRP